MDFGVRKRGVKNDVFWSEIESDLGNRAAHPHQEFPGVHSLPPPSLLSFKVIPLKLIYYQTFLETWHNQQF